MFIGRDMASHVSYSEETAAIIDEEIRSIVDDGLQKARQLLKTNRQLLDNMARRLVERETIFSEEVDMLMEGKSVEEIMKFMDEHERTLSENPFARRTASEVIVPEEKKQTATDESAETAQNTSVDGGSEQTEEPKEDKEQDKTE